MTSAGIEPATFGFVAQHLNHCAIAVSKYSCTAQIYQNFFHCHNTNTHRFGKYIFPKVTSNQIKLYVQVTSKTLCGVVSFKNGENPNKYKWYKLCEKTIKKIKTE